MSALYSPYEIRTPLLLKGHLFQCTMYNVHQPHIRTGYSYVCLHVNWRGSNFFAPTHIYWSSDHSATLHLLLYISSLSSYTGTQVCCDPVRKVITILLTNRCYVNDSNRTKELILLTRRLYNDAVVHVLHWRISSLDLCCSSMSSMLLVTLYSALHIMTAILCHMYTCCVVICFCWVHWHRWSECQAATGVCIALPGTLQLVPSMNIYTSPIQTDYVQLKPIHTAGHETNWSTNLWTCHIGTCN